MAQQTAVEWFVQQLEESGIDIGNGIKMAYPIPYDIYKEAKAMEKEQISEAYRKGVEEDVYNNPLKTGDEYYNETYLH